MYQLSTKDFCLYFTKIVFETPLEGSAVARTGASFTSEIIVDSIVKLQESVKVLPKVVGFLRVPRFPSTGNVDRVGWY
jgi:hypothetical protein